ncbi:MAG: T9SS type A sorting domain-containing protein [Flavobacteriaceae bacterium]|nr:T9SS type A sorting domain-containing protein [Flavobacteriaceae bacterium]
MSLFYKVLSSRFWAILLISGFLSAQYDQGIIISNEGNFGAPNAEVSFYNPQNQQVINNVYSTANNEPLGDVLQHIGFYGDKAYLVLNNSNKVVVVNRSTFVKEAEVSQNVVLPRYITFNNDKYYVSNSVTNSVSSYSISNNTPLQNITVAGAPENVESIGNHVFAQIGWYASGNVISVINSSNDTLLQNIELSPGGLNGMVANDTHLYVLTTGATFMHIFKINGTSLEIEAEFHTENIASASKFTIEDDLLFFVANGNQVYSLPTSLEGNPVLILNESNSTWSTFYGFNVWNGFVYSGDASGFTAPSQVKVYQIGSSSPTTQFSTGIGVNGFYLNDGNMSVEDSFANKIQLSIYPNPAKDFIQIQGIDRAEVSIYNVYGQRLKSINWKGERLNISDLTSGLYFVVFSTENGIITKKLLVR